MGLMFDFNNIFSSKQKNFSMGVFQENKSLVKEAAISLEQKRNSLAWRALPFAQDMVINDIISTAEKINKEYDNFVLLGIGGSALGPWAVFNAHKNQRHNYLSKEERGCVRFFVEDNIDPERMASLLDMIDLKKTMFNVVTKSGKTSETMAQLLLITNLLKKQGLDLKDHMIATTDEINGNLIKIARQEGLKTYYIPSGVGGRFSELCPVGLLPAAVCNIDIKMLLKGAADMDHICSGEDVHQNPASMYALLHVDGMKKGYNISVLMPYADSLKYISDWYAQLWAESLGKKYNNNGQVVGIGQTPVKAIGVTDQHSQIQLYAEGPDDKIITFLTTEKFRNDITIPKEYPYVEDISFLSGNTFGELLTAEMYATQYALTKAGKPNIMISLSEINEYNIGQLLYFFEMATAFAGEMLKINAFDQPGVEAGKIATFALMGKKGFDKQKREIFEGQGDTDILRIRTIM